jgi:hypothetical protein
VSDRFQDAAQSLLALLLPRVAAALGVYARWEYRVTGVLPPVVPVGFAITVPTLPLQISGTPISTSCPYGPLANITLWPGPDGAIAVPLPGSTVLVEFHDGDPAKPAVCGLDPQNPPQFVLLRALPGVPLQSVARFGDPVSGVAITGGSTSVFAAP